jgi:hypothetical protein
MAFDIEFDFRFAESDFFTDAVREVLDAAAGVWEGVIDEDFRDVPAGASFSVRDPSADGGRTEVTLETGIDDLRIFVGAHQPPFGIGDADTRTLARAMVDGGDITGDVYDARISGNFRGDGPVGDFEPFAGTVAINPAADWGIDPTAPVSGKLDLFTTVLHEIGHVLGLGASGTFDAKVDAESFRGTNARAANDGRPIPLTADGHHSDAAADSLMTPRLAIGTRLHPTTLDKAMLADIGYAIDGFTPVGETPAIVTDGDDRLVTGRAVADTLNGMGGADRLQGKAGDDVLHGGPGADTLMGQAGADTLRGGDGGDLLTGGAGDDRLAGQGGADRLFAGAGDDTLIAGAGTDSLRGGDGADVFMIPVSAGAVDLPDFVPSRDTLRIDPAFGLEDPSAVMASTQTGSRGQTAVTPGPGTTVAIRHTAPEALSDAIAIGGIPARRVEAGANTGPDPTARPDAFTVDAGDTATVVPVANDAAGDEADITAVTQPIHGTATVLDDGAVRFRAPAGLAGDVQFSYRVATDAGAADTATVTITPADAEADDATLPALPTLAPASQITALYLGVLGRVPDADGLAFWVDQFDRATAMDVPTETVLANIAESFRMSREGRERLPTLDMPASDTAAIDDVVETFHEGAFGGEPSPVEKQHWRGRIAAELEDGAALGETMVDMLTSAHAPEHGDTAALYHRIEVARTVLDMTAPGEPAAGGILADVDADREGVDTTLLGIGANPGDFDDAMIG